MIKESIQKVVNRENLKESEMIAAMTEIMSGEATEAQVGAFITALRMKGETVDEITGAVRVMRQFATHVELIPNMAVGIDRDDINLDYETILDTCGTGGDSTRTFNVSTATAIVVAGCGVFVAKHGNRSVSSLCGSADVLECLGVKLDITKERAQKCLSEVGLVFLFAPIYHTAMKHAINPRRQIGIRTIFNIIGPLSNPAGANAQVLGVYSQNLLEPIANVLKNLNTKHAFVVHGKETLDEISIIGETYVAELSKGDIKSYTISPEQFGFTRAPLSSIQGGDARQNAQIIMDIISGEEKGPKRDVVVLNAAFALVAAGKADTVKKGIALATTSLDKKHALKKLEMLKKWSQD